MASCFALLTRDQDDDDLKDEEDIARIEQKKMRADTEMAGAWSLRR